MARLTPTDTARLWEGLTHAHHVMSAALEKDMLPEAGIALGWFEVLHHLSRAPDASMRFQDLARVAGLTDSGASRRLEQMIKAGLIERRSCPTDRRGVFAHLTARGLAAYKRAHVVYIRSLTKNLGNRLEPAEADSLHAALQQIREAD